ncbi:carbohydrate ABC transporter substrate-binding protein [Streptomyces sp. TM32]|uniref:ABC transporter substrate-binding protein n=1 Tax=Streptomyces sp. TM32 TaxID=1652669 RepID=UPI001011F3AD|nr:ABC transporter substrate-binding protein [Streptomyces sp. TM32]RXS84874.1 carbohydrate ABC transporter substrate-binding protein [Streptomyces sp. TM32]
MNTLITRLTCCALSVALLLTAAACGSGQPPDRLTVMVPWSRAEFQAFYSVLKSFHRDTGIQVDVEVTRAQAEQLDAAVAAHATPDLAVLPSVGALDHYAENGNLQPLGAVTKDYREPFRGLATVHGKVYAVPVKADVKSLIWYNPAVTRTPPPSALPDLQTLTRRTPGAWCLGLASGPTSGWPGADWIADILLARNGPGGQGGRGDYEKWLSGDLAWNSPQVSEAWKTWRTLVADSLRGASVRAYDDAAGGMTAKRPTCSLAHGTLSAMGFPNSARPGTAYDYVTSVPESARRLEVSADYLGMFTKNPSAQALITYLSHADVQRDWVNKPGGYVFSADTKVTPAQYNNAVQRRIATMLQPYSGYTLCFSAADAMTPDLSAAFYRAVLDYAAGAPLQPLLQGLDAIQRSRGSSPAPAGSLCSASS